jgi:hypothetical protein
MSEPKQPIDANIFVRARKSAELLYIGRLREMRSNFLSGCAQKHISIADLEAVVETHYKLNTGNSDWTEECLTELMDYLGGSESLANEFLVMHSVDKIAAQIATLVAAESIWRKSGLQHAPELKRIHAQLQEKVTKMREIIENVSGAGEWMTRMTVDSYIAAVTNHLECDTNRGRA